MGLIAIMPESLANQIAAGEVVERPASCVKELIENSLDAGAHQVRVELSEGGISRIVVQDDGGGMDKEDAVLAFSRHATSKVKRTTDLFHITSLGFRGEALASIAAIARVTLITRTHDSAQGTEIHVEGTTVTVPPRPAGTPPGTRIEVSDLFFNTPARLKYLRSIATEQAHCVEVVQRAALSRPDVAFSCDIDGRTVFQTSGQNRLFDVAAAVFGIGEARQMLEITGQSPDYQIHGLIGRPTQARATRAHSHLFVNRRPIRNLAIHQAIAAGYGARLMVHRQPIYLVSIELDAALVDVNIHPHKAEVRFSEERDLCRLIQQATAHTLDQTLLAPRLIVPVQSYDRPRANVEQTKLPFLNKPSQPSSDFGSSYVHEAKNNSGSHSNRSMMRAPDSARPLPQSSIPAQALKAALSVEKDVEPSEKASPTARPKRGLWDLRVVGQALGVYMIADDGESLYIIDQHAAHERVLYERFQQKLSDGEIHRIELLTPIQLRLLPGQHAALLPHIHELAATGLVFEEFGGYDVLVRAVPDIWEGLDFTSLAEALVQSLSTVSRAVDVREFLRTEIAMRACKAAVKANHLLSVDEMEALCKALSNAEDPFHCPHGRPVFIRMSNHDLEKEFRRIV